VRLALSLLAVGLVLLLSYRGVRRNASDVEGGLAMGALFGFFALAVHSCFDFGLHIPSIVLLATVLCAQVCPLGGVSWQPVKDTSRQRDGPSVDETKCGREFMTSGGYTLRLWGLAPIAGAALLMVIGLALGHEGWRAYRTQELRRPASSSASSGSRSANYAYRVDTLAAAARLAPENARLQVELGLTHYDQYREQRRKLRLKNRLADVAQVVADPALRSSFGGTPALAPGWMVTAEYRKKLAKKDEGQLSREYLVPALRCFLLARELCPLLPEPHRLLASNADKLERADARSAYIERAAFVVPYDPALWYLCGEDLLERQPDRAWRYWQRSLALSDVYLPLVLEKSTAHLSPREICDKVLPHDPDVLRKAALQLYPEPTAGRRPFLDAALSLLEKQSAPRAKDLHIKALVLCALERLEEAAAAYQAALASEPRQASWRWEFARLLYQQQRLRESRLELLIVLSQQPNHSEARDFLTIVERKMAESM
jgi:hypothetical protein